MNPYTYTENVKNAIDHVRQFLEFNKEESVTGHHHAFEVLANGDRDEDTKKLDGLILRLLNDCHQYANDVTE